MLNVLNIFLKIEFFDPYCPLVIRMRGCVRFTGVLSHLLVVLVHFVVSSALSDKLSQTLSLRFGFAFGRLLDHQNWRNWQHQNS
jgi:hypothetical protein